MILYLFCFPRARLLSLTRAMQSSRMIVTCPVSSRANDAYTQEWTRGWGLRNRLQSNQAIKTCRCKHEQQTRIFMLYAQWCRSCIVEAAVHLCRLLLRQSSVILWTHRALLQRSAARRSKHRCTTVHVESLLNGRLPRCDTNCNEWFIWLYTNKSRLSTYTCSSCKS